MHKLKTYCSLWEIKLKMGLSRIPVLAKNRKSSKMAAYANPELINPSGRQTLTFGHCSISPT
jgi:hypothetical protein